MNTPKHPSTSIVIYGPWFVTNEGVPVIKRAILDDLFQPAGYELLTGDYDAMANKVAVCNELVAALDHLKRNVDMLAEQSDRNALDWLEKLRRGHGTLSVSMERATSILSRVLP